ncbi:LOW QUALITY PROTEIN: stomatin-like protein 1 [Manacus vitellinus]|uniref:LOW QUALITY PROTEIN: stomatin-like protein 1 n=1 Tax=Manacus vitellinus TaxID=328815 RepID=UPI00115DA725|nr:LOW QUALITY PROTEIN: stomatin-like protein 1 [Manacus vitellinus]
MFSRSGYQALPLGDFDRFQQSSIGFYGAQKGFFCFRDKQDPLGPAGNAIDTSQGWLSWICHGIITSLVFLLMVVTFPISGWFTLKVVPAYERMIIFRLGRIQAPQGPGMVLLLPFIDHWQRVDLRTRAFNVPPCKVTSKDGAIISMGADVQFRVWDPVLSVMMVKDLIAATRMTAQNAMTKTLMKKSLREIQVEKLRIGEQLLLEINDMTKSWGLEVDRVELSMEAVLQPPRENLAGPAAYCATVPGLGGLDAPFSSWAAHFFGSTLALAGGGTGAPEAADSVEMVNEVEPPTTPLLAQRKPSADELLSAVESVLSEALVSQVGASYQVNIALSSGTWSTYFIDLSSGSGRICRGVPEGVPDVTLQVSEKDLQDLFLGDLRPLSAYMSGRLQVTGDLHLALKLEELVKAMKQR